MLVQVIATLKRQTRPVTWKVIFQFWNSISALMAVKIVSHQNLTEYTVLYVNMTAFAIPGTQCDSVTPN